MTTDFAFFGYKLVSRLVTISQYLDMQREGYKEEVTLKNIM